LTGVTGDDFLGREFDHLSRLSWKWRKCSTVKITERTLEKST